MIPTHSRTAVGEGGGAEAIAGTRMCGNAESAKEEARARTESWPGREKFTNVGNGVKSQRNSGEDRPRSNSPRDTYGANGSYERVLWDELRDSLAGQGVLPSKWADDTAEKRRRDRAGEQQRRQLIDEAIAVLLEGSSSDDDRVERGSF